MIAIDRRELIIHRQIGLQDFGLQQEQIQSAKIDQTKNTAVRKPKRLAAGGIDIRHAEIEIESGVQSCLLEEHADTVGNKPRRVAAP